MLTRTKEHVLRENQDTSVRFIFKLLLDGLATVTMGIDAGGWISGTFELQSVVDPEGTNGFEGLLDVPLAFTISYESSNVTHETWWTKLDTSPVSVQFGGTASAVLNGEFAPTLSGGALHVQMTGGGDAMSIGIDPLGGANGPTIYTLTLMLPPVTGTCDPSGYPELGTFVTEAQVELRA